MVNISLGIKVEEFEFAEGQKITIKPVNGKYLKVLFAVTNKLSSVSSESLSDEESAGVFLSALGELDLDSVFEMCKDSIKHNFVTAEDLEQIDYFVSNQFLKLLPLVVKVNMS
jgi:hypothetical protein